MTVDQTLALSLRAARMLRKQLDEARAELEAAKADRDRILRELGANLGNAPEPGEIKRRVSELYARAEKAEAALFAANSEKELLALRQPTAAEMIAYLDGVADPPFGWSTIRRCVDCNEPVAGGPTRCIVCAVKAEVRSSQRRPSEAALASQPAAYPWSDEAVERATRAAIAERDRLGDEERAWVEGAPKFAVSSRIVRAALATLAPPQAATVPPVGVGDVWGDAVRVEYGGGDYVVMVGGHIVDRYTSGGYANAVAEYIRRGLASLPPLCAVLVGGVTEEMLEAYTYKQAWARYEASGDGRPPTMDECKAAGLTAALAAANIRVLGPGEGVVMVRVAKAGEKCPSGSVYRLPASHWYGSGAGGSVCETSEAWYILAADLDAAAAGVGKGGANG